MITYTIVIDNWFHAHTTAGRKTCGDRMKCWGFADRDCVSRRRYQLAAIAFLSSMEMQLVHEASNPNVVHSAGATTVHSKRSEGFRSPRACLSGATRTELISLCDWLHFGCKLIICSWWGVTALNTSGLSWFFQNPRFSRPPRGYEASLRW